MKKNLIYKDEKSDKFWKIEVSGSTHISYYGKTGTRGQRKTKEFSSAAAALKDAESLIAVKLKKGYIDAEDVAKKIATRHFYKYRKSVKITLNENKVVINRRSIIIEYLWENNRTTVKNFKRIKDAARFSDRLISKLLKKGYVEKSLERTHEETGITAQDVLKLIDKLNLPGVVKKIFLNQNIPSVIESTNTFYSPYPFFDMTREEQSVYGNGLIYPVISGCDFYQIIGYDIKKKKYVIFDIEDRINREIIAYFNWEQVLVKKFSEIISREISPEEINKMAEKIDELATLFNFPYGKRMFKDFYNRHFTDYDEIVKWENDQVRKMGKKDREKT